MFRDHIFYKETAADGSIVANFEGSLIMEEAEFTVIRNNMILRGIVGQSASNKNADGEEFKRIPTKSITGTREEKFRFKGKFTILELDNGNECRIKFFHPDKALPYLEEMLAKGREIEEAKVAAREELTDEEKALLAKLAKRDDLEELLEQEQAASAESDD